MRMNTAAFGSDFREITVMSETSSTSAQCIKQFELVPGVVFLHVKVLDQPLLYIDDSSLTEV